LTPPLAE